MARILLGVSGGIAAYKALELARLATKEGHSVRVLMTLAAKRARQINAYYHNLGEGTFDEYPPPMVETGSKNYLKISLEEVAQGKINYRYRV